MTATVAAQSNSHASVRIAPRIKWPSRSPTDIWKGQDNSVVMPIFFTADSFNERLEIRLFMRIVSRMQNPNAPPAALSNS
jgi:hypothetical protein